ncbi:MAG: RNA polymerase sigma factor [Bdellovibrionota bacterium]
MLIDWPSVVSDLGPQLLRYFSGSFERSIAADLVQETLIRLVQKNRAGDFDPSQGSIKAYAFGIARYVRLELIKTKNPLTLVSDDSELDIPVAPVGMDNSDPSTFLRWAITQLKPIEQEIILLMINEEIQLEEISMLLDTPTGTVKSHIHRAKDKLRKIMEAHYAV